MALLLHWTYCENGKPFIKKVAGVYGVIIFDYSYECGSEYLVLSELMSWNYSSTECLVKNYFL